MGPIIRLLIIAIVVWLAIQLLRRAFSKKSAPPSPDKLSEAPRMLPCQQCGVHIPEAQALLLSGKAYCCKEHLPDQAP